MTLDAADVDRLLEIELARITDAAVRRRAAELRVPTYAVEREWDYGAPGEAYVCWTVVEHPRVEIGIAYCAQGFGPRRPWGLVFVAGPHMSIGMDSGWFAAFEDAMRDLMGWDEDDAAAPGAERHE